MALLRETNTGSLVNVPDEKVAQVLAVGYYETADEPKKTTRKASSSKSSK